MQKGDYAGQTILGSPHWQDGRGAVDAAAWSDSPVFPRCHSWSDGRPLTSTEWWGRSRLFTQNTITLTACTWYRILADCGAIAAQDHPERKVASWKRASTCCQKALTRQNTGRNGRVAIVSPRTRDTSPTNTGRSSHTDRSPASDSRTWRTDLLPSRQTWRTSMWPLSPADESVCCSE